MGGTNDKMSTRIPNNKAKKQHWVPFSYLKYFSIPDTRYHENPNAWIFSKIEGAPRSIPLRTFARKKYLYSPRNKDGKRSWYTEDKLHDLETLVAKILPALNNGLVEFEENKTIKKSLALYISTLYLRHPSNIEKTKAIHSQFVEFFDGIPKDLDGNPFVGEIKHKGKIIPFDNSNYASYRSADEKEIQQQFVDFINSNANSIAELLLEKRWSIIFSEKSLFITTDNPVVIENTKKKGSSGLSVLFHETAAFRRLI